MKRECAGKPFKPISKFNCYNCHDCKKPKFDSNNANSRMSWNTNHVGNNERRRS